MINQKYRQWKTDLHRTARDKRMLISGQFELTGRCNLDCKMCYVHQLDHCAAKKKELTTEQWKSVFDQAYDLGMQFFVLTGGECLLRPDFKELYLHLWNKRATVSVFTNGTMLNEDYVAFFKKYRPEQIQISLYGSSEEGYLQVTGHKGFEKALTAIRSLIESGVDVVVAVTPSAYMKEDYIRILELCKENGFQVKPSEMTLIPNRDDPTKNDYYLSLDEMVDLSVRQAAIYKSPEPVKSTPKPGGAETVPPRGLTCTAGNCVCTVTWDGKMRLCSTLMIEGFDIREMSFREAWEKTKEAAVHVPLPIECVGCAYEKVCARCPAVRSPKMDGHCDPALCELTRRLVAAGVKALPKEE